jgi:hypothetical protein
MKRIITSNSRPLRRALCTLLLGIATLWTMPRNAGAQQLYVVQSTANSVGEYNATTGAAIKANFITGLNDPTWLLLSGDSLLVANTGAGTVVGYPTAGAVPNVIPVEPPFNNPTGLALSGNTLFVASGGAVNGKVGEYNVTTGAAINASLITGLNDPADVVLSGNSLLVANTGSGTVGEYNLSTGTFNPNFITGLNDPEGLLLSGNNLLVSNFAGGTVGEYNAATGDPINASFITGLNKPTGLALSGNNLLVSNFAGGTVGEYNATTGDSINATFITGLSGPVGLAVAPVPEPSARSMIAVGGAALLGIMLRKRQRSA